MKTHEKGTLLVLALLAAMLIMSQSAFGAEFGDAPEGDAANPVIAYPPGTYGAFPTYVNHGVAGHVKHALQLAWFGSGVDAEGDGNASNCPAFPPYDADECYADGDAGLVMPDAYTIVGPIPPGSVIPCVTPVQVPALGGGTCPTAVWGVDLDITVTNNMPSGTMGYVNVLMDWNQNGSWDAPSTCPSGSAPEHVLVNFPVPNGYSGQLSGLGPPSFLIGPNQGYVWARFTVSEGTAPSGWDGAADYEDGETEDYLLCVGAVCQPSPVETNSWGCIKGLYR